VRGRRGVIAIALLLAACSSDESSTPTTSTAPAVTGPCGGVAAAPGAYEHVIWIWMENKDSPKVLGSGEAPFLDGLAATCGSAANFVDGGIHPSLPNYIKATSGDPQGIADSGDPADHPLEVDNIFRQVRVAGGTAKTYAESMIGTCELTSRDTYAVRHNPETYYVGADDRTACERDDVPFDAFAADLAGELPSFSMIVPDLCSDMHDCPVATGDAWLRPVVESITSTSAYRAGDVALFIVFDESEGLGTMPFLAIAPSVVPGTSVTAELDHYSLLAFTEDALGIETHLGHAEGAADLAGPFNL
jgi:hypothetical protein